MDLQNKRILTFAEGCEYLGYAKSYVYKMTMQNILPFSKPNGKKIFFEREKLEAWMLSNPTKSHAERQIDAATYQNTKGGNAEMIQIKNSHHLQRANSIKPERKFNNNYSNQLKNPLWQKRRLDVFSRDHFSCTNCHALDKELQVHHLDYFSGILPWEYPLDMLTTLCIDCHKMEKAREKVEKNLLNSLKIKGFLVGDILHLSAKIYTDVEFTENLKNLLRAYEKE